MRSLPGLVLWCAGCVGTTGPTTTTAVANQADRSLGPGDVVEVRVLGEETLGGNYRVATDGSIDFPMVGRIPAESLEPELLADNLEVALREGQILRNPHVTVFVEEYNSKPVSVVGAVTSPGTFSVSSGMTVVQAITMAGGFTAMASRGGVVVRRQADSGIVRIPVDVADVMEGSAEDPLLQAGDIIYVPDRVL
ncbi:MAG: polysaccharide biosynthesis/export family protein [Myxococcota bacterium]